MINLVTDKIFVLFKTADFILFNKDNNKEVRAQALIDSQRIYFSTSMVQEILPPHVLKRGIVIRSTFSSIISSEESASFVSFYQNKRRRWV